MAPKTKDGFWKKELKLWGVAVKKVGLDFADTTKQVGSELLGAKPSKKKKLKTNRGGNQRRPNRGYR